jgi:hypothetical protein
MALVLKPSFTTNPAATESPEVDAVISALKMMPHIEGGYFIETDRSPLPHQSSHPNGLGSTLPVGIPQPQFTIFLHQMVLKEDSIETKGAQYTHYTRAEEDT